MMMMMMMITLNDLTTLFESSLSMFTLNNVTSYIEWQGIRVERQNLFLNFH